MSSSEPPKKKLKTKRLDHEGSTASTHGQTKGKYTASTEGSTRRKDDSGFGTKNKTGIQARDRDRGTEKSKTNTNSNTRKRPDGQLSLNAFFSSPSKIRKADDHKQSQGFRRVVSNAAAVGRQENGKDKANANDVEREVIDLDPDTPIPSEEDEPTDRNSGGNVIEILSDEEDKDDEKRFPFGGAGSETAIKSRSTEVESRLTPGRGAEDAGTDVQLARKLAVIEDGWVLDTHTGYAGELYFGPAVGTGKVTELHSRGENELESHPSQPPSSLRKPKRDLSSPLSRYSETEPPIATGIKLEDKNDGSPAADKSPSPIREVKPGDRDLKPSFSPSTPPNKKVMLLQSPARPFPSTSTSESSKTTKVINGAEFNWDVDSHLFDLESGCTSGWVGGKLPYEVLVGVYVQVGGTRSRLAIVRILTK